MLSFQKPPEPFVSIVVLYAALCGGSICKVTVSKGAVEFVTVAETLTTVFKSTVEVSLIAALVIVISGQSPIQTNRSVVSLGATLLSP